MIVCGRIIVRRILPRTQGDGVPREGTSRWFEDEPRTNCGSDAAKGSELMHGIVNRFDSLAIPPRFASREAQGIREIVRGGTITVAFRQQ